MYGATLSAAIQPNSAKVIEERFTVQMDNGLNRTTKAAQEFLKTRKLDILQ